MIRYVAFLRAINVAGQKLIKMEELARMFTAAGCKNARTYIQSGNVIFDAASANAGGLRKKIETTLQSVLGYEVTVILKPLAEIEAIVKRNPFRKVKAGADVVVFVVFLSGEPKRTPILPLVSKTENVEIFEVKDRAAFIVCHRKKNGGGEHPDTGFEKGMGGLGAATSAGTNNKIL